jgi:hypothetical protein
LPITALEAAEQARGRSAKGVVGGQGRALAKHASDLLDAHSSAAVRAQMG